MGLTTLIRDAVAQGINVQMGDLAKQEVTWFHVTPGVYDPVAGTTADVVVSFTFTVPVVRASQKESAEFPAAKNVQVVLVPYAQLHGLVPTLADYFTVGGVHWEVLRVARPPTEAITKFFVETP